MANQQQDQRTASQRIADLERAVMSIFQGSSQMAQDLQNTKQALKLINNKLSSVQTALLNGEQVSNEVLSRLMLENDMNELKGKVTDLINRGILVAQEVVDEASFIVGSESEPAAEDGTPGKVINARLQFALSSLDKSLQAQFANRKVGETIKFKDDNLVFNIAEVYKIVNPTPAPVPATEQAAEEPSAPAPAPAESAPAPAAEAPAAPQSSNDAAQAAQPAASTNQAAGN